MLLLYQKAWRPFGGRLGTLLSCFTSSRLVPMSAAIDLDHTPQN